MEENEENKDTLLARTFKVGEKKVCSEFRCFAYWATYGRFKIFATQNQNYNLFVFQMANIALNVKISKLDLF